MKLVGLHYAIILAGAVLVSYALPKHSPPKTYTVTLTLEQWIKAVGGMENATQLLKQSELPSKQVTYITDSLLIPSHRLIVDQINATLAAEKKAADSITKLKKN